VAEVAEEAGEVAVAEVVEAAEEAQWAVAEAVAPSAAAVEEVA
jgi:hypothetical protein